jgi:ribosomal-protein-alanine N-acetyltransferase
VGRQLLDDALQAARARRVASVYLEVRESNHAARTLYASRGFAPVGVRRGYYQHPPEDALVMRAVLGGELDDDGEEGGASLVNAPS